MKHILLLSILVCAAFSAPAEEQQEPQETAVDVQTEEMAPEQGPAARFNFCPDGWFSFENRCFKFINTPMNWFNAEEHCNNLGGHLASVSNPRQYNYLQQLTQTAGQSIAWLGGFWLQNQWLWINREGFYYTNWYSPSTSSSYPCIYLRSAYGWGNTQCTSAYRFICSKNPFGC
ncbi:ladderlectin-like isoform X1 [Fundulus heteroclitus]|uniref:ladderlectin-like isoform X1 n=1 Tax=Fundulus heteroclitus TaxID=8078 RepID=UPI00165C5788|nr:ladderlectin-like isoform X1 [Fundulus heteroclitus]